MSAGATTERRPATRAATGTARAATGATGKSAWSTTRATGVTAGSTAGTARPCRATGAGRSRRPGLARRRWDRLARGRHGATWGRRDRLAATRTGRGLVVGRAAGRRRWTAPPAGWTSARCRPAARVTRSGAGAGGLVPIRRQPRGWRSCAGPTLSAWRAGTGTAASSPGVRCGNSAGASGHLPQERRDIRDVSGDRERLRPGSRRASDAGLRGRFVGHRRSGSVGCPRSRRRRRPGTAEGASSTTGAAASGAGAALAAVFLRGGLLGRSVFLAVAFFLPPSGLLLGLRLLGLLVPRESVARRGDGPCRSTPRSATRSGS